MCFVKCVKKSFYPGSVVFLQLTEFITNLACKAGVFCSSSNDTIIGTNACSSTILGVETDRQLTRVKKLLQGRGRRV